MIWQKYAAERIAAAVDMTSLLDGAAIVGIPAITVVEGDIAADYHSFNGGLVKFWLDGGTFGSAQRVSVIVSTAETENLEFRGSVFIMA